EHAAPRPPVVALVPKGRAPDSLRLDPLPVRLAPPLRLVIAARCDEFHERGIRDIVAFERERGDTLLCPWKFVVPPEPHRGTISAKRHRSSRNFNRLLHRSGTTDRWTVAGRRAFHLERQ